MDQNEKLAEAFEAQRPQLQAVAYRMLGSAAEADDAVQEAWLRLSRSDSSSIDNLGGWLTTVVARVALDMLRSRKSRHEEPLEEHAGRTGEADPATEAVLADSVGVALLVVLDTLDPAERLAFVLHDMFAVPFDEIAAIIGRSPAAARQLASRARRRVRGAPRRSAGIKRQRKTVDAFLEALRNADFEGLIAVLDPDAVVRADAASRAPGSPPEVRGARNWAAQAIAFSRAAGVARPALIDGQVGLILAPGGHLSRALLFTFGRDGRIAQMDVVADPGHLGRLEIGVLDA